MRYRSQRRLMRSRMSWRGMNNLEHKPEWKEEYDELFVKLPPHLKGLPLAELIHEALIAYSDDTKAFIENQVIEKLIEDIPDYGEKPIYDMVKQQLRKKWLNN